MHQKNLSENPTFGFKTSTEHLPTVLTHVDFSVGNFKKSLDPLMR